MGTAGESSREWVDAVLVLLGGLMAGFEAHYGYAPDENEVVRRSVALDEATSAGLVGLGAPGELVGFYAVVGEVSLPDVGSGWFIDSAEDVVAFARDGVRPAGVSGALDGGIVVFGTDGGGGLLAIAGVDGRVYRLREGAFVKTMYEVETAGLEVLAADFPGFLRYLLDQVHAAAAPLPPTA
ncbi:hypothetical protein LV75_001640 [Actinokineospora diospyrosa]|uniref:SMI1/KNR4 family protein SUKH-1 n=1 Tax=Actinokineospora diospyrosa TaxID=103728 RepID=A0ABT1I990_9PSEU|nr:hypothetical protein [Actinokineospora diospyrosa]